MLSRREPGRENASQRGKLDHIFRMFGRLLGRHRKTPIALTVGVFYFPPSAPYLTRASPSLGDDDDSTSQYRRSFKKPRFLMRAYS